MKRPNLKYSKMKSIVDDIPIAFELLSRNYKLALLRCCFDFHRL